MENEKKSIHSTDSLIPDLHFMSNAVDELIKDLYQIFLDNYKKKFTSSDKEVNDDK